MPRLTKILLWGASLATLLFLGSLGYVLIEGWSFFDALYMTVTTLTTVGYGEIHPLDRTGRTYNMVLILAGMGVMLYIVGVPGPGSDGRGTPGSPGKAEIDQAQSKTQGSLYHLRLRPHRRNHRPATVQRRGIPLVVVENDPEVSPGWRPRGITFSPATPPGRRSSWRRASNGPRGWWRCCIRTPATSTSS